jgi:hypothetical protein
MKSVNLKMSSVSYLYIPNKLRTSFMRDQAFLTEFTSFSISWFGKIGFTI